MPARLSNQRSIGGGTSGSDSDGSSLPSDHASTSGRDKQIPFLR